MGGLAAGGVVGWLVCWVGGRLGKVTKSSWLGSELSFDNSDGELF